MTDQELRRALSQGPFTDLLDALAKDAVVSQVLGNCKLKSDDVAQLLLRYFQYHNSPPGTKFGKPSLAQNGLETMKHLNKEMKQWRGDEYWKQEKLVNPLKKSLELIYCVFGKDEAFRRPVPLIKGDNVVVEDTKKVWVDQNKIRDTIFDCTVAIFARDDIVAKEKAIRQNAGSVREGLITVMQTHPLFTDTLRSADINSRIQLLGAEVLSVVEDTAMNKRVSIPFQQRKELIGFARSHAQVCSLCGQPMGQYFDEHLHIDHIVPVSKGGTNERENLQVVHKTCNLMKSNNDNLTS